jgi:hypothetical protein
MANDNLQRCEIRKLRKGKGIKLAKVIKTLMSDIDDNIIGNAFIPINDYPNDHYIILKDKYKNIYFPDLNFWEVHFITHSDFFFKNVQFDKNWLLGHDLKIKLDEHSYLTSEIFIVNENDIDISEIFGHIDIDRFLYETN